MQIKGLRYQKWRLKQQMLDLDPTLKKKKGAAFFEIDEDLDKEWIEEHQAFLMEEQRTKISKKFEKDNEKRVADGEKEMKVSELEERLQVVKEMEKKFKKENKPERSRSRPEAQRLKSSRVPSLRSISESKRCPSRLRTRKTTKRLP
jgi:hypothetical protein